MSKSTETAEDRIAQRKKREDDLREALASMDFDGPHEIRGGGGFDPVSSMFGGGPTTYAICLKCAAMVRLGDPEERDGQTIERSIRIHRNWHDA